MSPKLTADTKSTTAPAQTNSGVTRFLPEPCSIQDRKAVTTIKNIISTIQHDGFLHPLGVEQGYIVNNLCETDVNEYIKQTYGSLLRFLQESAHTQDLKVTEDKKGKFFIDCVQQPKSVRTLESTEMVFSLQEYSCQDIREI